MSSAASAAHPLTRVKVLNNNVILAREPGGRELILVGRGLGFGGPSSLRSDDPRIEKVFVLAGEGRPLMRLIQSDAALTAACAEILGLAARRLGHDLSGQVYEAMAEHLALALQRTRLGVAVPNPFLAEIQSLYPEEYQVAGEGLEILAERMGTRLPEAERGFLALHLAAGRHGRSAKAMARHVAVVQEVLGEIRRLIRSGRGQAADPEAWEGAFRRLAVHLHHALLAAVQGRLTPNPLLDMIRETYPEAYRLARRLVDNMADRIGQPLPDDEAAYLAVHILRIQALEEEGGEEA